jgi:hypothetical protein
MDFYAPGLAMQAFFLLGTVDTNRFRREQLHAVGRESLPTDIWAEDLRQDPILRGALLHVSGPAGPRKLLCYRSSQLQMKYSSGAGLPRCDDGIAPGSTTGEGQPFLLQGTTVSGGRCRGPLFRVRLAIVWSAFPLSRVLYPTEGTRAQP